MKKDEEKWEDDDLPEDLSFIAHSLRTPLNTVIGECELMLHEEGIKESVKEKALLMGDAGHSLLIIINSILDSLNDLKASDEKALLLADMKNKLQEALLKSAESKGTPADSDISFDGASALLIDDNPVNLTVIKGLLEETGLSCDTAESGTEGIKMLDGKKYDILLLDHMMPDPDGVETLKMIREKGNKIPAIALTANYVPGGEDFYLSKGFDAYVSKPVEGDGLVIAMKKLIPSFVSKKKAGTVSDKEPSLSEDYSFLYEVQGLDVDKGIGYCGGVKGYIPALKMFFETLPGNHEAIKNAFLSEDYSLYTVKVHALKTSARMIGAQDLSDLSLSLEEAGKKGDISFIKENNEKLLSDYEALYDGLKKIGEDAKEGALKELPGKDVLPDALSAIKELVPAMDYDSIEMILSDIGNYSLEGEDKILYDRLLKALHTFDWDLMEELLKDQGGK